MVLIYINVINLLKYINNNNNNKIGRNIILPVTKL